VKKTLGAAVVLLLFACAVVVAVMPGPPFRASAMGPAAAQTPDERLRVALERGDARSVRAEVTAGADPSRVMHLDRFLSSDIVVALSPWVRP
jgi:hypothetical protein